MIQITTRVSEVVAKELDEVAVHFNNNRSEVLRQAIDRFLEEVEDASISLDRLKDPDANWLDWDDVKREFQDKLRNERKRSCCEYKARIANGFENPSTA